MDLNDEEYNKVLDHLNHIKFTKMEILELLSEDLDIDTELLMYIMPELSIKLARKIASTD